MVLLYDATGTYGASWARSAPAGSEATTVSDPATFDDVLARAHGVVAFVRGEKEDRQILERLRGMRAAYPLRFLVVVRPHTTGAALPLDADATLCAAGAGCTLWAAVRDIEARGLSPRLADVVRSAEVVPPFLRLALLHALLRPTPISSIKELAAEIGCDRRTLPRMWELAFKSSEPGGPRLIDFLDWVVLLYATGRKTPRRSWLLVSKDVGLTEDTLMRITRRLVGLSLSELTAFGQPAVLERFQDLFQRLFGRWPEALPPGIAPHRPACRVLVVDDHQAIGQFLDHTLRHAGFDVSTVQNGNEALLRMERGALLPTVVLADIRMPGMDGVDLAKRIATRWPAVRIVLMSAFISVDVTQLGWLREDIGCSVQFLSKPFTAGRVIALMREMCENVAQLPGV